MHPIYYEGPGLYAHYKGGVYYVLGVAEHESDTREDGTPVQLVVYISLSKDHQLDRHERGADFVLRPYGPHDGVDPFNDEVQGPDDFYVPRFRKVGPVA